MSTDQNTDEKREERNGFLFLTVFLAPGLAAALTGGLGLAIWIYQLIVGPPGASGS